MNWLTSGKKRGAKAAKDHIRQHRQQHYRQQAMERKQNLLPPAAPSYQHVSGTPIASGNSSQRSNPTPLISPISSICGSEKGWSAGQGQQPPPQQQRSAPFAYNNLPSKSSAPAMKPVARVSMDIVRLRKGQTLSRSDLGGTEQPAARRPQGDVSSVFGGMFKEELGRLNLQQTQAPREEPRHPKAAPPSSPPPGPTGVGRFGHDDEERPATAGSPIRAEPQVEGIRFFNNGMEVQPHGGPSTKSDKPPPPKQLSRFKLLLEEDEEDDVDASVGFDMFKRKLRQSASGGGSAVKQDGDKGEPGGLRMADLFRGAVPVGKQPCIAAARPGIKPAAPMAVSGKVTRAQNEITPEAAVKPLTMVNAPPRPAPPSQSHDWSSLASKMGLFDPASHSKSKDKALLNFKRQKEAAAQGDEDGDDDGFLVSPVKMKPDDVMSPGFRMSGKKGRMPKPHDVLEPLRAEVQAVSMFNRQLQMHEASQGKAGPEAAPLAPMPPLELSPKEDAGNLPGSQAAKPQRPSAMSLLSQLSSPVPTLPPSGVGRFASKPVSRSTNGLCPLTTDPSTAATSPVRSQQLTVSSTPMTAYDLLSDSSGSESGSPLGGRRYADSPVSRKRGRETALEGDDAAQHASTFANSLLSAADHEADIPREEERMSSGPATAQAGPAAAAPRLKSDGSLQPTSADANAASPRRPEKRVRLSPITPRRQARACHAEAAAARTPTGAGQVDEETVELPSKAVSHAHDAPTTTTTSTLAPAATAFAAPIQDEEQRRQVEALRREVEELRRTVETQRATMADQQSSIIYYQLLARCLRVEAEQDARGLVQGGPQEQPDPEAAVSPSLQAEGPVAMEHLDNNDQGDDDLPPTPATLPPDSGDAEGTDKGDSAADDQAGEQVASAEAICTGA